MTDFSVLPRLNRAGFIVLDRKTGRPRRVLRFQINPDQLVRSLELREDAEPSPGTPPAESFAIEAELNADEDSPGRRLVHGVAARIAAIAALVTPRVREQIEVDRQAAEGALELREEVRELILFYWGPRHVAPVRLTELRITEEAFAADLTPVRAKLSIGLRVVRPSDLGLDTIGGSFALAYQYQRQSLADAGRGDLE